MKRILFALMIVMAICQTAAAQASSPAPKSAASDEQVLREHDLECVQAMVARKTDVIDRLEADDFIFIGPDGHVWDKAQDIASIKSGDVVFESINLDDVKVRVFGDAAVVSGRSTVKGRYKEINISGKYRYTSVWVKRDGRWRSVQSQMTRIMEY
jgi:ketosteroid isomerase-like protein